MVAALLALVSLGAEDLERDARRGFLGDGRLGWLLFLPRRRLLGFVDGLRLVVIVLPLPPRLEASVDLPNGRLAFVCDWISAVNTATDTTAGTPDADLTREPFQQPFSLPFLAPPPESCSPMRGSYLEAVARGCQNSFRP